MAADFDFEGLGLLDGLEGQARKERAELIEWLLDRGFSIDHICESAAAPLMLPASKVLGDDGDFVSAPRGLWATAATSYRLARSVRRPGSNCSCCNGYNARSACRSTTQTRPSCCVLTERPPPARSSSSIWGSIPTTLSP